MVLDLHVEKGESRVKQEIMKEIREQEADLAQQEKRMIKLFIMAFGIGISFLARRLMDKQLHKAFD